MTTAASSSNSPGQGPSGLTLGMIPFDHAEVIAMSTSPAIAKLANILTKVVFADDIASFSKYTASIYSKSDLDTIASHVASHTETSSTQLNCGPIVPPTALDTGSGSDKGSDSGTRSESATPSIETTPSQGQAYSSSTFKEALLSWFFLVGKLYCHVTKQSPIVHRLVQITHIFIPQAQRMNADKVCPSLSLPSNQCLLTGNQLLWFEFVIGMNPNTLCVHSRLLLMPRTYTLSPFSNYISPQLKCAAQCMPSLPVISPFLSQSLRAFPKLSSF
jgi:hypothetical protein